MKTSCRAPGVVGRLEGKENMAIGSVIQRSGSLVVYDERGHQTGMVLTASGDSELQGYTSSTVSVRRGNLVLTYNERGQQMGTALVR